MRIAIREQLAALVTFNVLLALAVVSIPVWLFVQNFVVSVESSSLALTASLKAARVASEVQIIQTLCQLIVSRLLVQQALEDFYANNYTDPDSLWSNATADILSAFSVNNNSDLFQARLYSRNTTGDPNGLLNITGEGVGNQTVNIQLPYLAPDGRPANLSNETWGYPSMLYPNITYVAQGIPNAFFNETESFAADVAPGVSIYNNGGLLLGPLVVNDSFALVSITLPVESIYIPGYILGYMTVIASAESLIDIITSREGLGETGMVLVIGSSNRYNNFNHTLSPNNGSYTPNYTALKDVPVHFILPAVTPAGVADRHAMHDYASGNYGSPFPLSDYPIALKVFYDNDTSVNNSTAKLSTTNEQGVSVAVGAARPDTTLVTWAVLVEQAESEAYQPIHTLRKILLGCVFGTVGLVLVFIVPCAHLGVLPIKRLKEATQNSIAPPGYEDDDYEDVDEENPSSGGTTSGRLSEKGLFGSFRRRIRKRRKPRMRLSSSAAAAAAAEPRRQQFKIPAQVVDRKHFVTDELTELTQTFNTMTEELLKQYTSLDEKVAERTRELEISKKAAEAANESKTLFVANISHELKTPLNGILGMCSVCIDEDDIGSIKQNLKTMYKSGELLLNLLEDLLNFSKNQVGSQIRLEEKEFRLGEVRLQIAALFEKQARENQISYSVRFIGASDDRGPFQNPDTDSRLPVLGPAGVGRLKDMCLWGDTTRILQVAINLISNSLKFTPVGGKVDVRIRCLGEVESSGDESSASSLSKGGAGSGSHRAGRARHRVDSSPPQPPSSQSAATVATALSINPAEPRTGLHVVARDEDRDRSVSPPPANAKTFMFVFEVSDTGPGIPGHMRQKIFEPFVQGDLGLSKKYGGTGLGLSICHQLVSLMAGRIELDSEVGVGTTFRVYIPLKHVRSRASSTASSSVKSRTASCDSLRPEQVQVRSSMEQKAPPGVLDNQPRLVGLSRPYFSAHPAATAVNGDGPMGAVVGTPGGGRAERTSSALRVLVADDNSTNIEVISKILRLEDITQVEVAKDGQEAYEMVRDVMGKNQRFDVIFMDIQMPNLDGLQSTRLIRKMGYSAPIVALTAFSEESNVKQCMECGMDEFLSKPIKRPALKKVLQKYSTIPEEPELERGSSCMSTPAVEKTEDEAARDKAATATAATATTDREVENTTGAHPELKANGRPVAPGVPASCSWDGDGQRGL